MPLPSGAVVLEQLINGPEVYYLPGPNDTAVYAYDSTSGTTSELADLGSVVGFEGTPNGYIQGDGPLASVVDYFGERPVVYPGGQTLIF